MIITPSDLAWMRQAIDWSRHCPRVVSAYNVGAVIVADGVELAHGFARETDHKIHAEESALRKLVGIDLTTATIYTTLEPCSKRASRPRTCTQLILDAGIQRVLFALQEPPLFVECEGMEILAAAGVQVIEVAELADDVIAINSHVIRT